MSTLLFWLSGEPAYILWKQYRVFSDAKGNTIHICLLRFVVNGYTSVVFGRGKSQYLASSKALHEYHVFAERIGMDISSGVPIEALPQLDPIQLDLAHESDEAWFKMLSK